MLINFIMKKVTGYELNMLKHDCFTNLSMSSILLVGTNYAVLADIHLSEKGKRGLESKKLTERISMKLNWPGGYAVDKKAM